MKKSFVTSKRAVYFVIDMSKRSNPIIGQIYSKHSNLKAAKKIYDTTPHLPLLICEADPELLVGNYVANHEINPLGLVN